jgi:hypothetical protein
MAEEISKGKSCSLTPSCFTLSPNKLDQMFKCLLGVRFPVGYVVLISRYLDPNKKIFIRMKFHDCHIMMMQILSVAIRGIMEPHVDTSILHHYFVS